MSKLINNHVTFSFDNNDNLHSNAKFYRYLDTLHALGKLTYEPKLGTGMWNNYLEPIVMMDYNDFVEHVYYTEWVSQQECFLRLAPRNPRTSLYYDGYLFNEDMKGEYLGSWKEVTADKAYENNAYSHFGDLYFVCSTS